MIFNSKPRKFMFKGQQLPDLNLSIPETKNHYETQHPELMNCEISQKETDDELIITFAQKFAQKG